jgi:hypothetical protein
VTSRTIRAILRRAARWRWRARGSPVDKHS